jgi:hypothetical protein
MSEKIPKHFEEGPEPIPTQEEVLSLFEKLVGEKKYEEIRKLEDEEGLYLWDIKIHGEDGDTEYSYRRGRQSEGQLPGLRIDVTFFDNEDVPVGGHSVAKFINGEWKLTP